MQRAVAWLPFFVDIPHSKLNWSFIMGMYRVYVVRNNGQQVTETFRTLNAAEDYAAIQDCEGHTVFIEYPLGR